MDYYKMLVTLVIAGYSAVGVVFGAESTKPATPRVFAMDGTVLAQTKAQLASGENKFEPALKSLRQVADRSLTAGPFSVTEKTLSTPSGDKHDYISFGPYWWPDPDSTEGLPYVHKDGQLNPESRDGTDRIPLGRMAEAVRVLALAYYLTDHEPYAERAALLLRTWFLDKETRMNPHVRYGQGIPGRVLGRGEGVIDTARLIDVCDAVGLLANSPAWTEKDQKGMEKWFGDYLDWLLTSDIGKCSAGRANNHGAWFDAQAVTYALFSGNNDVALEILEAAKTKRIQSHFEPDGSQPHELNRTRPIAYCVYNLRAFITLAGLGERAGVDLWNFSTEDGRSIRKALEWLTPYLTGDKKLEKEEVSPLPVPHIAALRLLRTAAAVYDSQEFARAAASLPGVTPEIMAADQSALLYPDR